MTRAFVGFKVSCLQSTGRCPGSERTEGQPSAA
jgi:hypothetical protein